MASSLGLPYKYLVMPCCTSTFESISFYDGSCHCLISFSLRITTAISLSIFTSLFTMTTLKGVAEADKRQTGLEARISLLILLRSCLAVPALFHVLVMEPISRVKPRQPFVHYVQYLHDKFFFSPSQPLRIQTRALWNDKSKELSAHIFGVPGEVFDLTLEGERKEYKEEGEGPDLALGGPLSSNNPTELPLLQFTVPGSAVGVMTYCATASPCNFLTTLQRSEAGGLK